ncbi:spore gernimation protein [Gordoniibacillus kamchatkensis]|uniref:Spore gernimation protein n=1 Tax=Gordoniibacillus kamchatkensis TaxID=1590651 RepID=A0ABR5AIH5_9BACL|nr:spore gernimation protein [Paenibacillus sp. VKM B-2647]
MEKGKISALQMAMLTNPTILATAILSAPAITAKLAEHDMWLSPVWASLAGIAAVYLAWGLNKLYPAESIIDISVRIAGRAAGKLLGFVYLFFYLHVNGIIVREYGEFVVGSFLTKTPLGIVIASIVAVSAFAVYGGVEVLGRCAQIMVPVVVLLFIVIIILLFPDLNPENMLPFMEKGIKSSFMGALVPQGWFSEYFVMTFLLPLVADRAKAPKWGVISAMSVMFILVIGNITTLMLFGDITGTLTYPVLIAARYISLADFFEHVESIVMAIWVTGMFIKISVFYYILALGTAQWLKLSDFRPLVLPLGLCLASFGVWAAPNSEKLLHDLGTTIPFYLSAVQVVIPLLLLLIALLKQKLRRQNGG